MYFVCQKVWFKKFIHERPDELHRNVLYGNLLSNHEELRAESIQMSN